MKFNRNRKNSAGFSLIELLVVVAIMLVIAAIAVPSLLAAKRNANDGTAIQGLRQLANAELSFSNAYQNGYTGTLANLGAATAGTCTPITATTNTQACLIDDTWSSTGIKSGFTYALTAIAGTATSAPYFVASAVPNQLGVSGNQSYCVMSDNVVRVDASGAADSTGAK
jgi:type IV pilus assembly protein PilA